MRRRSGLPGASGHPLLRLRAEDAGRLGATLPILKDPEAAVVFSPSGTAYARMPLVVDVID